MNSMETSRANVLQSLVNLSSSLEDVRAALASFSWDYTGEPQVLTALNVRSVLQRFVAQELTSAEVESWANLIEGREDVVLQTAADNTLDEVLYELANPTLTQSLTPQRARTILVDLSEG